MVFLGLTMACRLASWPTSRSPDSGKPTTEGVRFDPCLLGMTLTSLPSMMATTEFVVPRSMPTILLMRPPKEKERRENTLSRREEPRGIRPLCGGVVSLIPRAGQDDGNLVARSNEGRVYVMSENGHDSTRRPRQP